MHISCIMYMYIHVAARVTLNSLVGGPRAVLSGYLAPTRVTVTVRHIYTCLSSSRRHPQVQESRLYGSFTTRMHKLPRKMTCVSRAFSTFRPFDLSDYTTSRATSLCLLPAAAPGIAGIHSAAPNSPTEHLPRSYGPRWSHSRCHSSYCGIHFSCSAQD